MESEVELNQYHRHEDEEKDDFIARPLYSLTTASSLVPPPLIYNTSLCICSDLFSYWQIKKKRSPLKIKKKLAPKKPSNLKSNPKHVISDECGKTRRCKKKRTRIEDLYDNAEAKFSVMVRAEEVLANVADGFPSFVKCMLPSNVTHGFWLILPTIFCKLHLPMHDATLILEDERGKEYEANYLVERHGLSAGWRGFSQSHRLLKGDILVFHLIRPCTLKVHIVRVYGLDEVDAALCLVNLVAPAKIKCYHKNIGTRKKAKKYVKSHLLDFPQKNIQTNCPAVHYSTHGLVADQSKTNSDGSGSEVSEGIPPSTWVLMCSMGLMLLCTD